MSFFFLYILTFFTSALLLSFSGLDFLTCISAAASTISNVGPGLGPVIGPDGYYGNLSINVTSININKIKKDEYYRFEIDISIEFFETNEVLNKRKIYKINSIEYGDIEGSFSIKDTENLNKNIISNSLKSINQKVSGM